MLFLSEITSIATFRSNGNGVWNGIRGTLAMGYFGTPLGWKLTPHWGWRSFHDEFYRPIADASPNAGHQALARLQKERFGSNRLQFVTMNVDGLHVSN